MPREVQKVPQNETRVVRLSRRQRRDMSFSASASHPLQVYRPHRVAQLFDVDESTVLAWRKDGVLPEPAVRIGRVFGWTHAQISALFTKES
jgi:hypothetical protein